VSTNMKETNTI